MPGVRARKGLRWPSRELALLAAIQALVLCCLLAVTAAGIAALSGVRAYVGGEGLWSKGQKAATHHLTLYALDGDPAEYERYRRSVAVPLADARARLALSGRSPDLAGAERALVLGRNHPDDVPWMARLFLRADWLAEMREAIGIWSRADALIGRLDEVARAIHAEIDSGSPDRAHLDALRADVRRLDERLTALEDGFSYTLGAGARRLSRLVLESASAAALALLMLSVLSSGRLLRRMRRGEQRFRSMIEHVHDVITILRPDGAILYNSPAVLRLLGYRPEELEGESVLELIHPDDRALAGDAIARVAADPSRAETVEVRLRHRAGHWRTVSATGAALPDPEGGGLAVVVDSHDRTEERRLEARLAEAERMESIGRLAGGVAHDFNNILTAILGSAELARAELPAGCDARLEVDGIAESAERAADLTRQLLAFARRQMIEPRVLDLGEVARGLEGMLRRLIDETIELRIECGPEPLAVRADPAQMEQVILNLAVNARDAMPDGGRLTISTSRVWLGADEADEETEGRQGAFARLEVLDSGEGMSPEVRSHVFEPFFTTRARGAGTGLGLATCYGIVKQSGGSISVRSEPGKGSCFRIHLPCEDERPARRDAASPQAPPTGSGTVLVAEDEPRVRRIAVQSLRACGYRVLEAADGEEALRLARSASPPVDLLVTDVVMPRMGGRELATTLARERAGLRVLYVSGYTQDDTLRDGLGAGRAGFLRKPFRPGELAHSVQQLLGD